MFLQMQHCCFPDLGVCFKIVVRINHNNVAKRGAVGHTHTIVTLQTRICRKNGTENFAGFVFVLDVFVRRDFGLCFFFVLGLISVSFCRLPRRGLPRPTGLFSGYHDEGYHAPPVSFPATTPRGTTPHRSLFPLPRRGLRPYRYIQVNRLPPLQGYDTRATTSRRVSCHGQRFSTPMTARNLSSFNSPV